MEICDLECRGLELAVEMGARLGISSYIINAWGLDVSYSNLYVVSQPFHEECLLGSC